MEQDFRLGAWLVQPTRNRIEGPNGSTTVKPRSMAVLARLATARGEVVPKGALMDSVWGSAAVTEDTLTQCIVELRKAFGDSATSPAVIETIRRVGFRLIPPVEPVRRAGASRPGALAMTGIAALVVTAAVVFFIERASLPPIVESASIAVLPFDNLSADPENQYLGDGLAEELLDRLTKVPGLRVPARTSSFAFRDEPMDIRSIGSRLGVANVLEGSVRKSGGRIRITVQLIDVASGDHVWSQVFERDAGDVFAIQDEIAETIVVSLGPSLGDAGAADDVVGTLDIGAYDLYLLGRHELAQQRTARARELFEKAIEKDAGFARAYAGLAMASLGFRDTPGALWRADPDGAGQARAEWAIEQALELDPRLAEAYVALAALSVARGDAGAEEAALRRALDLRPGYVEAHASLAASLAAQGRYAEALEAYATAAALDPLNADIAAARSQLVGQVHGFDAAVADLLRLVDSDVRSPQVYEALISLNSDFGRYDERVKWGLQLVERVPYRASALAELADAYMELGEFELALAWSARASEMSPAASFKARARALFAAGDTAGFDTLVTKTLESNPLRGDEPLDLVQSIVLPLYSINLLHAGDSAGAAHYIERLLRESRAVPRRPPHIGMYGRALLANAYRRMGDDERAEAVLARSLAIANNAERQGIDAFPPLTRELAKVHALRGEPNDALAMQTAAVAQGWRQLYLEAASTSLDPVGQLLQGDARYSELVAEAEADLERMRLIVRRNGWAVTPEEFLGSR